MFRGLLSKASAKPKPELPTIQVLRFGLAKSMATNAIFGHWVFFYMRCVRSLCLLKVETSPACTAKSSKANTKIFLRCIQTS